MLLFLLSILSSYNTSAVAVPLDIIAQDEPISCEDPLKRSLFGIAWSCFVTIFISAWTTLHPNVPPRNRWQARWNRLKMMVCIIVAPDLVLMWAVRQFFGAKEIRDEYNSYRPDMPPWEKWTLIHGHFFQMGGFTLVDPDRKDAGPKEQNRTVLTFDQFRYLCRDPNFKMPRVTAGDIMERSKGDGLFRLIAILQTAWFILQCIARRMQGLTITQLELVTLALTSLHGVTFMLWWYKPIRVQEPVKIYLRTEPEAAPHIEQEDQSYDHLSYSDVIRKSWKDVKDVATAGFDFLQNPRKFGVISAFLGFFIGMPLILLSYIAYIITFPFFVLFPLGIIFLLKFIKPEPVLEPRSRSVRQFRYALSSAAHKWFREILDETIIVTFPFGWLIVLPLLFLYTVFLPPILTLTFLASQILATIYSITTTTYPGSPFYAPTTRSDRWSRMVIFPIFGTIFGSIYCIGWNFSYPTHFEQLLWRATSLAITVIPLIVAPIDFYLTVIWVQRTLYLILDFMMHILLFIYILARLSLIAQAFVLLRNQPSSAFVIVEWTNYIPHLFS